MLGVSGEHLLILGVVLLIFGPKRLPELGNTLGKAIRNFRDAISGVEEAQFHKLEAKKQETSPLPPSVPPIVSENQPVVTPSATTLTHPPA